MTYKDSDKKKILLFAIIAGGLFFYFYYGVYKLLYANFDVLGQDFMHYYFVAQNYVNGRSIYIMPPSVTPYSYLPAITLLFLPFARLTGTQGRLLWLLICHILTVVAFWKIYGYGRGKGKLLSAASAAAVLFFSTPLYQTLLTGNINIFIFSGLSLVYAALLAGRNSLIPQALALFSAIKIFPAVMLGVFIRRRNYSACWYFMLILAALAAISVAVFGVHDSLFYVRQLPGMTRYSGIIHAMSLTFVLKLFWPALDAGAIFLPNLLFLSALSAAWWLVSGKYLNAGDSPGKAAADLFILTEIMILVAPSSWIFYCAFYAMPFYFVVFSLLEGRRDFRFPWLFLLVLLFFNFWEIIYYHFPLSLEGLTARAVEMDKGLHPVLYPLVFSMHFAANLSLFVWTLANYGELAKTIERIIMTGRGPAEKISA